jgi:hypothetical protein
VVIVSSSEQPPTGPISIGGYGFFASVDGGGEIQVTCHAAAGERCRVTIDET